VVLGLNGGSCVERDVGSRITNLEYRHIINTLVRWRVDYISAEQGMNTDSYVLTKG
jgi:hypothetical protein